MNFAQLSFLLIRLLEPWYRNAIPPYIFGLVYMSSYRVNQMEHHMFETSGPDRLELPVGTCGSHDEKFRTYEGHCNAINLPNGSFSFPDVANIGAKDSRMISFHKPVTTDSNSLFDPEPFDIAERITRRNGTQKTAKIMNLLAAGWIQFNLHDWLNHTSDFSQPAFKVKVGKNYYHDLPPTTRDELGYTLNQMTPWWDLGNIYGQDKEFAYSLRQDGKCEIAMTADEDPLLRLGPDGVPLGGASHNWWVGMEIFHTLFVKEHNHVCKILRKAHPEPLSETALFEPTRHIIAAYVSKIHTTEWTPALLQNPVMNVSVRTNWDGTGPALTKVLFSNSGVCPHFCAERDFRAGHGYQADSSIFLKTYDWLGRKAAQLLDYFTKIRNLPNLGTGVQRFFYGVSYKYIPTSRASETRFALPKTMRHLQHVCLNTNNGESGCRAE
eukprot:jgi/Botrbrau1/17143/Bobra.0157s0039.1